MINPRLTLVLGELAELLDASGESAKADRVRAMLSALASPMDENQYRILREELARWTRGMGSLNDLVLRPALGASLDKTQANERLGRLTDELYELTTS